MTGPYSCTFDRLVNFYIEEANVGVRVEKDQVSGKSRYQFYQRVKSKSSGLKPTEDSNPNVEQIRAIGKKVFPLQEVIPIKKEGKKKSKNILVRGYKTLKRRLTSKKKEKEPLEELFGLVFKNFEKHFHKEALDELPKQLGDWFHHAESKINDVAKKREAFVYAVALVRFLVFFPPEGNSTKKVEEEKAKIIIKDWFVDEKKMQEFWKNHPLCTIVAKFLAVYERKRPSSVDVTLQQGRPRGDSYSQARKTPSRLAQLQQSGRIRAMTFDSYSLPPLPQLPLSSSKKIGSEGFGSIPMRPDDQGINGKVDISPYLQQQLSQQQKTESDNSLPPLPQIPLGSNRGTMYIPNSSQPPQPSNAKEPTEYALMPDPGSVSPYEQTGLSHSPSHFTGLTVLERFKQNTPKKEGSTEYGAFNLSQKGTLPPTQSIPDTLSVTTTEYGNFMPGQKSKVTGTSETSNSDQISSNQSFETNRFPQEESVSYAPMSIEEMLQQNQQNSEKWEDPPPANPNPKSEEFGVLPSMDSYSPYD